MHGLLQACRILPFFFHTPRFYVYGVMEKAMTYTTAETEWQQCNLIRVFIRLWEMECFYAGIL